MGGGEASLRLDKWLFFARFFKTRTLAAELCASGRIRVSGSLVVKAHHRVRVGDVVTFPQGRYVRVVRIASLASRRGPAPEARLLYEDLSPPEEQTPLPREAGAMPLAERPRGSGRPTKRERRILDRMRGD